MANLAGYTLRNVPLVLWRKVQKKAADEGVSVRVVILRLLQQYAEGKP